MTQNTHIDEAELQALNNELANLVEKDKPMYGIHYGSLYTQGMTTKECAAEIRKVLRRLSRSKHSPLSGADVSVRMARFAGGSSIDVTVTVPYPVRVEDDDAEGWNRQDGKRWPWLTDRARAAKQTAEELHNAYNFDGSDSQVDYFHVNYYGTVEIREAKS